MQSEFIYSGKKISLRDMIDSAVQRRFDSAIVIGLMETGS